MADDDATTGKPAKRAARAAAPPKKTTPVKKAATRKAIPVPPASTEKSSRSRKAADDASAKKAAPRKATSRRGAAAESAPTTPRKRVGSRLAAEQTFDDDWDTPAPPPPPASDPAARARALLRSAAADLQAREAPSGRLTGYEAKPDEPVTEVFVAPTQRSLGRRAVPAPAPEPEPEPAVEADPEAEVEVVPEEATEAEWTIEEQDIDEEPAADRIPDAFDVLSVPGTTPSSRPSSRRRSKAPPSPPPPTPERDEPTATEPVDSDPLPWTPPPSPAKSERSGGAGLSVLAIVLSIVVPIVGAIIGFVLATRARRRGLALSGLARVVAVVALVAWLAVAAVALVAKEGIDYSKLKVGDCFDSSATNEVRGIDVKPCAEEHNSEVFFLVTHPAGPEEPYPGKDALVQFAADACLGQPLTDYLGIPLEQSKFKDFEIVPQESAWKDGRRLLVCGIDTGGEGRITGSVKGTAQ